MPVEHIVLLRTRPEATEAQGLAMCRALKALEGEIPGVLEVLAGRNETPRTAGGFNYALVVRLESRAALAAYGPHPAHQRVLKEHIQPILADILAIDYDVD